MKIVHGSLGPRSTGRGLNNTGKNYGMLTEKEKLEFLKNCNALRYDHKRKDEPKSEIVFLSDSQSKKGGYQQKGLYYSY